MSTRESLAKNLYGVTRMLKELNVAAQTAGVYEGQGVTREAIKKLERECHDLVAWLYRDARP